MVKNLIYELSTKFQGPLFVRNETTYAFLRGLACSSFCDVFFVSYFDRLRRKYFREQHGKPANSAFLSSRSEWTNFHGQTDSNILDCDRIDK